MTKKPDKMAATEAAWTKAIARAVNRRGILALTQSR
jgi:hypothetical protein